MFNNVRDSQLMASSKYKEEKLDRYSLYLPKGQLKEIKAHAKEFQAQIGEPGKTGYSPRGSVNAFVNRAIREAIERDKE